MKYYEAYEERYKTIHKKGFSWSSDIATPIVLETIKKYKINPSDKILEIGCGEGRDARPLLEKGFNLLATDISEEAIDYCQKIMPKFSNHFQTLDCLNGELNGKYKFIYAVAVIHMLVLDEDRRLFYKFIRDHLLDGGVALICSMGNGQIEVQSNINNAFNIEKREHPSGEVEVTATSCRMVSFETFEDEIKSANLEIIEEGITPSMPDFNELMYVVVK